MPSSIIEGLLMNTGAAALTDIFIGILVVCFGLAIYFKMTNKGHGFTQYAPTLLTTLGILGTFVGIISGLLGFDVDNIDDSIGGLLAGLKTAFITSLVGMLLSIAYKLLLSSGLISPNVVAGQIDEDEIGIAELYGAMREQADGVKGLQQAIGGEGDASLISQIKLLRSDLGDSHKATLNTLTTTAANVEQLTSLAGQQQQAFAEFQDRLWIKLQDFADMLSKSATEQVINALKEVISDFNNNLIEQFGENFKQLNAAVLELVQWQENYKLQLGQMSEQYQQGVLAITQTEAAVSHISEEAKVIPTSMHELKGVMEVNQHQLAELERHLEAFKDIRDRAVEAVPEIRTQIDDTVNGMKEATNVMTQGLQLATETVTTGIVEATQTMQKSVTESAEGMKEAINAGSQLFIDDSQRVSEVLKDSGHTMADNTDKTRQLLDDALTETNSILRVMVADLKDDSSQLTESYKTASQTLISETDVLRQQVNDSLKQQAEQQAQVNKGVLDAMSKQAESALTSTGEAVEKQIKMLDDALERELTQVMTEMGRALTTISGKFTSDYQQLVTEMQKVTRSGSGS